MTLDVKALRMRKSHPGAKMIASDLLPARLATVMKTRRLRRRTKLQNRNAADSPRSHRRIVKRRPETLPSKKRNQTKSHRITVMVRAVGNTRLRIKKSAVAGSSG